jgi:hypothetical protein
MKYLVALFVISCLLLGVHADDPCQSGLAPKQRPGPYSFLVSVGKERGQQHCYICETGDRPMVVIFARSLSDPLAGLVKKLDAAVDTHRAAQLRGWVTFLAADQTAWDGKIGAWARQHGVKQVPLGVFEDEVGPPTYRLAREADITILLANKKSVVANFAFRAKELNDDAIATIIKSVDALVKK